MKTCVLLWYYLAELFLDWENFQTNVVGKCSLTFSWKSCRLLDSVEKHGGAGQATDDNTAHALCMPNELSL